MHAPATHTSVCVHASRSLQALPFAETGFEHAPVPGSQTPFSWHGSSAVQVRGMPVHEPATQASPVVQRLPSSHAVPFAFGMTTH